MDAVIPAAGRGSRLGELTAARPRGLVEVTGRPHLVGVFETPIDTESTSWPVSPVFEAE